MEFLVWIMLLGIIPGAIAHSKGRSFFGWWVYGALLFIIALPHSIIMSADVEALEEDQIEQGMKKCPYCAEMIKGEAIVCRYCNRDQEEVSPPTKDPHEGD